MSLSCLKSFNDFPFAIKLQILTSASHTNPNTVSMPDLTPFHPLPFDPCSATSLIFNLFLKPSKFISSLCALHQSGPLCRFLPYCLPRWLFLAFRSQLKSLLFRELFLDHPVANSLISITSST